MKNSALSALALAISVTGCGSDPAPEPVEQIVVREPGAAPTVATKADANGNSDLISQGKAAFAVCSACHSVQSGGPSGAGPNLYGVADRKAGSLANFANYSGAIVNSGISWDDANLDTYIANPQGKIPGTSMAAGAVNDPEKRKAIIAYLRSLQE